MEKFKFETWGVSPPFVRRRVVVRIDRTDGQFNPWGFFVLWEADYGKVWVAHSVGPNTYLPTISNYREIEGDFTEEFALAFAKENSSLYAYDRVNCH